MRGVGSVELWKMCFEKVLRGHVRLSQEKDRLATGREKYKKAKVKDTFKWGILTF
jgi:hypothetical protein